MTLVRHNAGPERLSVAWARSIGGRSWSGARKVRPLARNAEAEADWRARAQVSMAVE